MSSKILVVDDSPTVQKVVAITLANEGYELSQALNEDDLTQKIKGTHYDLILLDFTVSPKKSGYELIKQIQASSVGTPILLLLGQFDQVDDKVLEKLGVREKMIKPFDSVRFIERCRELIENAPLATDKVLMDAEEVFEPAPQKEEWKVETPQVAFPAKPVLPGKRKETQAPAEIKREIESWGVPVPSIIGQELSSSIELPPVIEETSHAETPETHYQYPSNDDLDFPNMGSHDVSPEALTQATLSSRLVPIDDLMPEEGDKGFADEQTERMSLPSGLKENLELEIQNDSAEEFWMTDVDTSESSKEEPKVVSSTTLEETEDSSLQFQVEKEELVQKVIEAAPALNKEDILKELREALPSIVEEYVKDYCQKTLEKVAWEVIPDLAENLIRKELRSIADSIPKE